ncbi:MULTISPECIES: YqcI/YcgG family protein [Rodentibacter]|uniref:YqcI/YcgG family protein n=1 Tax=Rodentibacter TaxID=1960084 RepID=UPI001CFE61BF|nr:YqcI/YcgG family protein [Rodentibacter sp. JRC1]GJI55804.1 hypothetical protein HEMROJRC1_09160 [Rodentibacter sp. JRC1]
MNKVRPFPCVFGVKGFTKDQIRYVFQENIEPIYLANVLRDYLKYCKSYGNYTSLVIFEKPNQISTLEEYHSKFWGILKELSDLDYAKPVDSIPAELDTPMWEFSFNGELIFVVCTTPAHQKRQSRRSTGFILTFQPRWVFDDLLGSEEKAEVAFKTVRERLEKYDLISQSPYLGKYGDKNNREWKQYFLDDTNEINIKCPFHKLK